MRFANGAERWDCDIRPAKVMFEDDEQAIAEALRNETGQDRAGRGVVMPTIGVKCSKAPAIDSPPGARLIACGDLRLRAGAEWIEQYFSLP